MNDYFFLFFLILVIAISFLQSNDRLKLEKKIDKLELQMNEMRTDIIRNYIRILDK